MLMSSNRHLFATIMARISISDGDTRPQYRAAVHCGLLRREEACGNASTGDNSTVKEWLVITPCAAINAAIGDNAQVIIKSRRRRPRMSALC